MTISMNMTTTTTATACCLFFILTINNNVVLGLTTPFLVPPPRTHHRYHQRQSSRTISLSLQPVAAEVAVISVHDEKEWYNSTQLTSLPTSTTTIQQQALPLWQTDPTTTTTTMMDVLADMSVDDDVVGTINEGTTITRSNPATQNDDDDYKRGLLTIGFITVLFSSNSPVLHAAFGGATPPPVLLLNAAVSVVALIGLVLGGDSLESQTSVPSTSSSSSSSSSSVLLLQQQEKEEKQSVLALQGGCELGLWKFLATTANLYGLALTTAGHGALLIQLTTLIVPIVQGIQGVPIPHRIQVSVILALAGVVCFTQDPSGTPSATGDALCVLAAIFYATYDLRLFTWGKKVDTRRLITSKIATQAILSVTLLAMVCGPQSIQYVLSTDTPWNSIVPVVLWSGVAVNAVAPYLQVGGQQIIGPTRCQTIYASQPLWAALLSYVALGETIGFQGMVGGSIFLVALFLAATTTTIER